MKRILIVIFCLTVTNAYSAESRLFQFVSQEKGKSYLSLEAGTSAGINLISNRMQVSLLYYIRGIYGIRGVSVSTDLFLLNYNFTENLKVKLGIGGGIIFNSEIDNFESNALLRMPVNFEFNNLYFSCVPMIGLTMFEYKNYWISNISINIGYQFDLYRDKDKKEEK